MGEGLDAGNENIAQRSGSGQAPATDADDRSQRLQDETPGDTTLGGRREEIDAEAQAEGRAGNSD